MTVTNTMNGVAQPMPTASDIETLKQLFKGTNAKVLSPSDDGFEQSMERWSRAAEKQAGVAVLPTTAQETGIAVKFATDNNFDLAVKCGGHSTAGASCTNGGVQIDLGLMKNIKVDEEKNVLRIQGGCVWGEVDEAAWKYGLATVGGTVADTGVGGLVLGGGYGNLSGKYGLAIDNLIGVTVVLSTGEVVYASEDEHPDLFWGMRGAGQNFGVATEFVVQAYPQGEIYMGHMIFAPTPENIKKVVDASNNLYELRDTPEGPKAKSGGRTNSVLGFAKPPPAGGKTMLMFVAAVFGTEEEGKEMLSEFFDAAPISHTMHMGPYPRVNTLLPARPGFRTSVKGAAFTLPLRDEFVVKMLGMYEDFQNSCDDAGASVVAWEFFDPAVVIASDKGCFANRGRHLNSVIMPMWTKPENDQPCRKWGPKMSLQFKEELERQGEATGRGVKGGVGIRGHKGAVLLYGNYDQYDERSKDIFGDNYERLQTIKATYDPTNKFNKLFRITPSKPKEQSVPVVARAGQMHPLPALGQVQN